MLVIPDDIVHDILCVSYPREAIVEYLEELEVSKPLYSNERRNQKLEEENAAVGNDFRRMLECDKENYAIIM